MIPRSCVIRVLPAAAVSPVPILPIRVDPGGAAALAGRAGTAGAGRSRWGMCMGAAGGWVGSDGRRWFGHDLFPFHR